MPGRRRPRSPTPRLSRAGPARAAQADRARLRGRAAAARRSFPDLHLDVIGEGWWHDELVDGRADLGVADRVDLPRPRRRRPSATGCSRGAWVMLLPSVKEGWGLAVMEAGAQGTPSVAYRDAGGVTESVVDGETGLLVDDLDELVDGASADCSATTPQRSALGAAARAGRGRSRGMRARPGSRGCSGRCRSAGGSVAVDEDRLAGRVGVRAPGSGSRRVRPAGGAADDAADEDRQDDRDQEAADELRPAAPVPGLLTACLPLTKLPSVRLHHPGRASRSRRARIRVADRAPAATSSASRCAAHTASLPAAAPDVLGDRPPRARGRGRRRASAGPARGPWCRPAPPRGRRGRARPRSRRARAASRPAGPASRAGPISAASELSPGTSTTPPGASRW